MSARWSEPSRSVDMLFLDGEKTLYPTLLRKLEPALRPSSLVISDNVDFEGARTLTALAESPR
ncbi:hypothetical protein ACWEKT_02315 [Nocardia takedensis]